MNRDDHASYVNRPETDGITFYNTENMARFLIEIVKAGLTYKVAHMPYDNSSEEFWIVTLTGGF
jgi:hypothetical protein